jgi:hypothetical protein
MAESKSTCSALYFKDHSEKLAKFHLFSINGLGTGSECAVGPVALKFGRGRQDIEPIPAADDPKAVDVRAREHAGLCARALLA